MVTPSADPGLQPERTQLSWERTGLGFLGVGILIMLRHVELAFFGRALSATIAFILTITIVWTGRKRSGETALSSGRISTIGFATFGLAATIVVLMTMAES